MTEMSKGGTSHQLKNTGKKIATAEAAAIITPMISINMKNQEKERTLR